LKFGDQIYQGDVDDVSLILCRKVDLLELEKCITKVVLCMLDSLKREKLQAKPSTFGLMVPIIEDK
jgi:hypothetical protein